MPSRKPVTAPSVQLHILQRQTRPQGPSNEAAAARRWRDAATQLRALQADYADWLAAILESLQDSSTARTLEAIVDLDIAALADISHPRGLRRG